jgi:hypothetical protein
VVSRDPTALDLILQFVGRQREALAEVRRAFGPGGAEATQDAADRLRAIEARALALKEALRKLCPIGPGFVDDLGPRPPHC